MEVIKPSLIENKNTTNIQTAMEQVPGVNITDGQANIRGGSGWSYGAGTRVQVLVDDMPLISGDAGQAQWSLISTENINQVDNPFYKEKISKMEENLKNSLGKNFWNKPTWSY